LQQVTLYSHFPLPHHRPLAVGALDYHLTQCALGPQGSPSQAGPQSVQLFLCSRAARQTETDKPLCEIISRNRLYYAQCGLKIQPIVLHGVKFTNASANHMKLFKTDNKQSEKQTDPCKFFGQRLGNVSWSVGHTCFQLRQQSYKLVFRSIRLTYVTTTTALTEIKHGFSTRLFVNNSSRDRDGKRRRYANY